MTEPSWLPQTWPSDAPDIEGHYERMAPRQWPKGLYREDSEAVKDQKVFGLVFSWIRKMFWWIQNTYHPSQDTTEGYLIKNWESDFGHNSTGSLQERCNRIVAGFRNRGTATEARIKAIFAIIFNTDQASDISLVTVSATEAWAASLNGQKLVWPYDVTQDLYSIWGANSDVVFAVGPGGKIYAWTTEGGGWIEQTSGTTNDLYSVWVPIDDDSYAWTVGDSGTIREWNGTAWSAGPGGGSADDLKAVCGTPTKRWSGSTWVPEEMWVCGVSRCVNHWDGSTWTNEKPGNVGENYADIHVYAIDDVWVCGNALGDVIHWDGSSWTTYSGVGTRLNGIRKMPNGRVYTVGDGGEIWEYDGSWSSMTSGTTEDLFGIDGWYDDRMVVVGENGICLRYTGEIDDTWETIEVNCWHNLRSVWVDRTSAYSFCAGDDGWTQRAPDSAKSFAKNQNCLHIYSTNGTLPPDYSIGWAKTVLCQAAWQQWTVGQKKTLLASDNACGADISCAE